MARRDRPAGAGGRASGSVPMLFKRCRRAGPQGNRQAVSAGAAAQGAALGADSGPGSGNVDDASATGGRDAFDGSGGRGVQGVPAAGCDRFRQDRGVPASRGRRGPAGDASADPRPRDRPDTCARWAALQNLRRTCRCAALLDVGKRTARRVGAGEARPGGRHRRAAVGSVGASCAPGRRGRGRGTGHVVQTGGGAALPRTGSGAHHRPAPGDPGRPGLGDPLARGASPGGAGQGGGARPSGARRRRPSSRRGGRGPERRAARAG